MSAANAEPEEASYNDQVTAPTADHEGGVSQVSSMQEPSKQAHEHARIPSNDSTSEDEVKVEEEKPVGQDLERTKSQAESLGTAKITIIMASLCMALFLAALDITIITTALPTIAGHFKASSADYTWIGSSYLLACSAAVPLWGKISDIWGRKPIILTANVIFMVGSLISALANSVGMLIAGRVVQGIGGGGLVILCNICVSDLFSMRDRAKYFGILGMVWAVASGVGPIVGGVFSEKVSWRWCFYINLPLDGVAFLALVFFLKLETPKTALTDGLKAIDWVGVLLVIGGVVMFLFGMESGGQTQPWDSAYTICLIVFGIFTVGLFFINEWKFAKYPIMPPRLFRDKSNLAALGVCFCHGFVFISGSYYLPLYFQTVLQATPILSGVYLFPFVFSLSFGSAATGIVIKKTGRYREPIWFGMAMMTLGFGLFISLESTANWAKIIIFQIIAGIGVGPNFQSPLIAIQSHVKGYDVAVATATFGFVRQLGTSISIVLGGVVFQNELKKKRSFLEAHLGAKLADELAGSSFGSTTRLLRTLPKAQKDAVDTAYTSALKTMWIFYVAFAALGIAISLFITKKELSRENNTAKTGVAEQERVRLEEKAARKDRKGIAGGSRPGTAETAGKEEV